MDLDIEEDRVLNEAEQSIVRLATRLRIPKDVAAAYLVFHDWNEQMFNDEYLQSDRYFYMSTTYFVKEPVFDTKKSQCCSCFFPQVCLNIGCGHYVCQSCYEKRIVPEIFEGVVNILCPNISCGKYIAHSLIKLVATEEEKQKFDHSILASKKKRLAEEEKSLFAKFVDKGKG